MSDDEKMNIEALAPLSDVESRLKHLESQGLTPSQALGGSKSAGPWQPPTPEDLQAQLPQYKVLNLLGRGGMGAVYQGWQTSLDRYVAIKILPQDLDGSDANFAARFKQEAKTMARLSHPGIIAVIDAGETASGLLYFVMECVEGTDVARMVKDQGKLDPSHALAITAHVCDALGYAHEHGVIHRDIKPANVMLNLEGQVKVADFGLAKSVAAQSGVLTMASTTMGTPDYIAPEALIPGIVGDHRVDLYAVGVMLYNMLTGEIPRGRFRPASEKSGCDARFDAIVERAMETERERRYQSAAEMRSDLDVILTTPPEKPRTDDISVLGGGAQAGDDKLRSREANVVSPSKTSSVMIVLIVGMVALLGIGAFFAFKPPRSGDISVATPGGSAPLAPAPATGMIAVSGGNATVATATKDIPFINTLGMKFIPVPILGGPTGGQRVLFSVWETRVQDYAEFVKETKRKWPKADFAQEPTHPAVNVSWEDAQVFCQWLTGREQRAGRLPAERRYRLPSDHEWSCAVSLGAREDASETPEEKTFKISNVFPWGKQWPPPVGAGNFAGEELKPALAAGKFSYIIGVIEGWHDEFVNTAPVGSFQSDGSGLFDLSGNAREWCEDWFNKDQKEPVLRGGSWIIGGRGSLQSCYRYHAAASFRGNYYGFRCVVAGSAR